MLTYLHTQSFTISLESGSFITLTFPVSWRIKNPELHNPYNTPWVSYEKTIEEQYQETGTVNRISTKVLERAISNNILCY